MKVLSITLTTVAGALTTYAEYPITAGKLYAVKFKLGTLQSGAVDVTVSVTNTGDGVDYTLLTLSNLAANAIYYPREQVHGNTGAGLYIDQAGLRIFPTCPIVSGLIKVVVAQASGAQTGQITFYIDED